MKKRFTNFDIKFAKPRKEVLKPVAKVLDLPKTAPKKIMRQLAAFTLSAFLLVFIIQMGLYASNARNASGEILGAATSAYTDLNSAQKSLTDQNFTSAKILFDSAQSNVKLAQDRLNNFKPLTWITPQGNSADHILSGASYLAAAGEKLSTALKLFEELKVSSKGVETADFDQKLLANRQVLIETRDFVYKSAAEFDQVKNIPLDYADTLDKAKEQVSQLALVLDKLIGLENLYSGIFGGEKTYLLIFQNYDEQRATGGFIGTFGVLKTNRGAISKLKIDSIYDLDGQINELVAAPGPFQPEIARWGIRDANWFIDFPTSAQKLLYFFEKGSETADGVIATTPKLFEDLLRLVGPIEMKEYKVTLTAENFQDVVQYKTSVDYDRRENEPKKMLADFAPMILDRLKSLPQDQWFNFFQIMQDNLNQRQALLYSMDSQVQTSIEDLGFSGRILDTEYDYLNIVNSNLGGTKTDLEIDQKVNLKSKILSDGSILNSLTITRTNNSLQTNKNYLRVLVPKGSEFISATGFDALPHRSSTAEGLRTDENLAAWDVGELRSDVFVRTEALKTEFAGWMIMEPESEKIVALNYMLPFKVGAAHSLLLQKQAGSKSYQFEGSLNLGRYTASWISSGVSKSSGNLNFKSSSNVDDVFGFVLTK